jgi:hypothetical protein
MKIQVPSLPLHCYTLSMSVSIRNDSLRAEEQARDKSCLMTTDTGAPMMTTQARGRNGLANISCKWHQERPSPACKKH